MITGRLITSTGYTMILPSIGSTGTTIMLLYLATQAGRQTFDQFLLWAGITAIFMGTVMGVVPVASMNRRRRCRGLTLTAAARLATLASMSSPDAMSASARSTAASRSAPCVSGDNSGRQRRHGR